MKKDPDRTGRQARPPAEAKPAGRGGPRRKDAAGGRPDKSDTTSLGAALREALKRE